MDAGITYRQSAAKYRDCLATAATPHACEREKLIMEADERALTNTAAAVDGG